MSSNLSVLLVTSIHKRRIETSWEHIANLKISLNEQKMKTVIVCDPINHHFVTTLRVCLHYSQSSLHYKLFTFRMRINLKILITTKQHFVTSVHRKRTTREKWCISHSIKFRSFCNGLKRHCDAKYINTKKIPAIKLNHIFAVNL